MPFFSIIIPTYNAGSFITSSLKSVLDQDFNDYEIIIQDGASTDNTVEKAKEMLKKSGTNSVRAIVITERDKGIYDAMNRGIRNSQGKYIYFLGADDRLFDNQVLKDIHSILTKGDWDMLYGNVKREFGGREIIYDGPFDKWKILHTNISHQAIFYKKEIFERLGQFNLTYKVFADWDLNIRIFQSNSKIKFFDRIIAFFESGGTSSSISDPFDAIRLQMQKGKPLLRVKSFFIRNFQKLFK